MSNYQHQAQDMYHGDPSSRSPGSHRHPPQQLHRQPSRQFDAYGSMPSALYEDFTTRYEAARPERMNQAMPANPGYSYDISASQTWTTNGLGGNNAHTLGSLGAMSGSASTRMKPVRARSGLPATWLDQQPATLSAPFQLPGSVQPPQMSPQNLSTDVEDELIPTAIVIKNIPFAVKKEQLVQLMTDMALPLPYAFNYHFDNGIFRGLAFANFTSAEETAVVIDALNHFELQGRKLRVEYKKMLPLQERERIEREKRERRGQLEEQHRPMAASQLQSQNSMSSLASHLPTTSPSPVSQRAQKLDVDMNDTQTLAYYSQLLLFKQDPSREALIFSSSLTPLQRRTVHTLAHNMGLCHVSHGQGNERQVHVFRTQSGSNVSPPAQATPITLNASETARRGLNRAATIDFSEARAEAPNPFGTIRSHNSAFLNVMDSSNGLGNPQNLRAAKSFADLRSFTPSPVPSSASFPAALQTNGARVQHYDGSASGNSNTPTLTPTPGSSAFGGMQRPQDNLLVDSFGTLSLGTGVGGNTLGGNSSPRRLRSMFSWEHQDSQAAPTGPIGSNRGFGMGYEQSQDRIPMRQPRGPAPERGTGFRRNGHQSRGSDEARVNSGVDIIVE